MYIFPCVYRLRVLFLDTKQLTQAKVCRTSLLRGRHRKMAAAPSGSSSRLIMPRLTTRPLRLWLAHLIRLGREGGPLSPNTRGTQTLHLVLGEQVPHMVRHQTTHLTYKPSQLGDAYEHRHYALVLLKEKAFFGACHYLHTKPMLRVRRAGQE